MLNYANNPIWPIWEHALPLTLTVCGSWTTLTRLCFFPWPASGSGRLGLPSGDGRGGRRRRPYLHPREGTAWTRGHPAETGPVRRRTRAARRCADRLRYIGLGALPEPALSPRIRTGARERRPPPPPSRRQRRLECYVSVGASTYQTRVEIVFNHLRRACIRGDSYFRFIFIWCNLDIAGTWYHASMCTVH